jgi:hypothetical protein
MTGYGMSDGEETSALIRKHLESTPGDERKNVAHTLSELMLDEATRLHDMAKDRIPGWSAGTSFDTGVFADETSTWNILDRKA